MATGALVPAFGGTGVVTSDPSSSQDQAYAAAIDGTNLYVVGWQGGATPGWRVEKRSTLTGALVAGFGSGGVVSEPLVTGGSSPSAVTTDATDVFVLGSVWAGAVPGNDWRIEKRTK